MARAEFAKHFLGPQYLLTISAENVKPLRERLIRMEENQLYMYICGQILDAENKAYGKKGNTELHKMVFLTGGPSKDINRVRDAEGNPVCKNPQAGKRSPEICEAIEETWIYEVSKDPTKICSEVPDVAHNLILLTVLDPDVELPHEGQKIVYEDCIERLAESLDLEVRHLLLLSAVKYTQRLGMGKNPQAEEELIRNLIVEGLVPSPAIDNMKRTRKALQAIDRVLEPRLNHLAQEKGWSLTSSENSNHIFK